MLRCFVTSKPHPSADARWTVGELLDWTTRKFEEIGVDSPRTDAQYLLAHALECSRTDLYVQLHRLLEESERQGFRDMVRRRLKREPVAYIEGTRAFHALDLDLEVNRDVLIPRPETEHLVDWALELLKTAPPGAKVLDVGTGSGAIALAIKKAREDLEVHAVDISHAALEVAQRNAQRLGLQIHFQRSDLLGALIAANLGGFSLVCANLPYIPSSDIQELQPEVRMWEPHLALDGGNDGLATIQNMLGQAPWRTFLAPQGHVLLEIGVEQAAAVMALMRQCGFVDVELRRDYGGIERVLRGSCFPYQPSEDSAHTHVELDPDPRWVAEQQRERMAMAHDSAATDDGSAPKGPVERDAELPEDKAGR